MLTLVLGGISSGKSGFAVRLAAAAGGDVLFIATGQASDPEMEARISAHRRSRPRAWRVAEEPLHPDRAAAGAAVVLLDSIDGWVANLMEAEGGAGAGWLGVNLRRMEADCGAALERLAAAAPRVVCVSSEVGMAMVPLHPYGRAFADLLGRVNQRAAALAADAYLVTAGRPLPLPPPGS